MLRTGSVHYTKSLLRTQMIEFIYRDSIESLPPPRMLNTNLPLRMLPRQVAEKRLKCIQIRRNPKDVCVSMFNNVRNFVSLNTYEGYFSEFTETFLCWENVSHIIIIDAFHDKSFMKTVFAWSLLVF